MADQSAIDCSGPLPLDQNREQVAGNRVELTLKPEPCNLTWIQRKGNDSLKSFQEDAYELAKNFRGVSGWT
ncbi:MAG: hypothetical protein A2660_00015 [Candidatus Doudnabacteria bacterium RIFCSPHIGHO2_01_FULL_45_18]|uniref:Uncharacterized protein n=1 Tax=Candidatus Doudnabacteria bacterium RIFCSPHIGHO2_01_FULL_45_18 TaxID=1817823 RepID=A0A1F5NRJ5_9BACT|nr:MAG: hypothetical protein A2660_00015 [Candidatus Doudnabacteria bacterium RIFCSPHIGHO2_01_FULL_45_18]